VLEKHFPVFKHAKDGQLVLPPHVYFKPHNPRHLYLSYIDLDRYNA